MINRNNYEEYFLLLADNELSAEEAIAVKLFAAQHPDLAEELDILMSCRLEVDAIPAFPKEKLLRTTLWNADNPEPVHTQMLLMLDGELAATEKQQLQAQIANSSTLQTEWNTLQQTKLVAEALVHPDKESLWRNDRKVRPLLWMRWVAAAAVVTGLGWFTWMQQKPQAVAPSNTIASITTPKKEVIENTQPQSSTNTSSQPVTNDDAQPAQTQQITATTPSTQTQADNRQPQTNSQSAEPKVSLAANDNTGLVSNSGTENTPVEVEPVTARLSSTDVSLTTDQADVTEQVAHLSTKTITSPLLAANQKIDAFTGSKNGMLEEEDDYITVGGARINRHKMRGLFRNVTRSVARTFSKSKMEPDVYATR